MRSVAQDPTDRIGQFNPPMPRLVRWTIALLVYALTLVADDLRSRSTPAALSGRDSSSTRPWSLITMVSAEEAERVPPWEVRGTDYKMHGFEPLPQASDLSSPISKAIVEGVHQSLHRVERISSMVGFKVLAPLAALAASLVSATPTPRDLKSRWYFPTEVDVLTATVKDLQAFLSNGTITSVQLTQHYLVGLNGHARLDSTNTLLARRTASPTTTMPVSISALSSRRLRMTRSSLSPSRWTKSGPTAPSDRSFTASRCCSRWVKAVACQRLQLTSLHTRQDNIATEVELGMNTTAGSYALLGSVVPGDAPVSAKLRKVIRPWASSEIRSNISTFAGRCHRSGQSVSTAIAGQ